MTRAVGAAVALTIALLAMTGCGGDDAFTLTDEDAEAAFCRFTRLADETLVDDDGGSRTWLELVTDEANTRYNRGASGLVTLSRWSVPDAGPYEAAMDHLDRRGRAWSDMLETGESEPELDAEVIEAARTLDEDLADGLCDPG